MSQSNFVETMQISYHFHRKRYTYSYAAKMCRPTFLADEGWSPATIGPQLQQLARLRRPGWIHLVPIVCPLQLLHATSVHRLG